IALGQSCIKSSRRVALTEDEAVAIGIVGAFGIDLYRAPIRCDQDIDARHGRAQMWRSRAMRHLDQLAANTTGDQIEVFKRAPLFRGFRDGRRAHEPPPTVESQIPNPKSQQNPEVKNTNLCLTTPDAR